MYRLEVSWAATIVIPHEPLSATDWLAGQAASDYNTRGLILGFHAHLGTNQHSVNTTRHYSTSQSRRRS